MSLILTQCSSPETWDAFNAESQQGNVFCSTAFINALSVDYELWFITKNGEHEAGVIILRQNNEPVMSPFPFTMYQGILFSQKIVSQQVHRRVKSMLELFEFMLLKLSTVHSRLSFCLNYSLIDIRGIQWFHYNEPHLGRFNIDLKYTGLIDSETSSDFETYLTTIRKVRRYEYRKALHDGLKVVISNDMDTLDYLHDLTFQRQGVQREESKKVLLRKITETALSRGYGELLICQTKDGTPASATLFLYDDKCGYYLFGANDPAYRNTGSGTFLLLENIRRCFERGLRYVDVCGINSPHRGDFKTSFNAVPVPYYVVTWERPKT